MGAKYVLQMGIRYQVGDGKSIRVWEAPWIHNIPNFIPQPRDPSAQHITWAHELMTSDGKDWNMKLVTNLFWQQEVETIKSIPISQAGSKDRLVWQFHKKGIYTVHSAYQQLQHRDANMRQQVETSSDMAMKRSMWRRMWKMQVKEKLKHFVWRCYHNILPTNLQLDMKGIQIDTTCPMCVEGEENLEHLLFNCSRAQVIWKIAPVQ